jgi:hypothetical protein
MHLLFSLVQLLSSKSLFGFADFFFLRRNQKFIRTPLEGNKNGGQLCKGA